MADSLPSPSKGEARRLVPFSPARFPNELIVGNYLFFRLFGRHFPGWRLDVREVSRPVRSRRARGPTHRRQTHWAGVVCSHAIRLEREHWRETNWRTERIQSRSGITDWLTQFQRRAAGSRARSERARLPRQKPTRGRGCGRRMAQPLAAGPAPPPRTRLRLQRSQVAITISDSSTWASDIASSPGD